ncbi:MAG: LPS export ABC transporter periplasmic protein LptC [Gammaproteobacteria bacterium]|nr:LPS export ABC transporter periplasmic protein LptC [Gammaproteobacteria bacterium]
MLFQRLWKSFVPLLVVLVAGLSVWLFQKQPDKGPIVTPQTQRVPDSFMENFTTQVLDEQGRPQYQLQATHMAHYADDDRSEFTQPQFTAFQSDGQRWTAVAETGRAENGNGQIFLDGSVIIQRYPDELASANLQIRTRDVRVRPADDYAETNQAATIVQNEDTLKTVGLQVYFRKGQVQLLSQVRGIYAP